MGHKITEMSRQVLPNLWFYLVCFLKVCWEAVAIWAKFIFKALVLCVVVMFKLMGIAVGGLVGRR